MTSVWVRAQEKQAARRGLGRARAEAGTADGGEYMESLLELGRRYHVADAKNNNTTAVGIATVGNGDPHLFIAFKGPPLRSREEVYLAAGELELGVEDAASVHVLGNDSGLHCEMAIVQAACGGLRDRLANEEFYLEIACIGKGVCPDCSGFLQKHHIPHTQGRTKLASDWVNPFTGAHYTGSGNALQYIKKKTTFSATTKSVPYVKGWAK